MARRFAMSPVRRPLASMRTISSSRGVRPGVWSRPAASRRSRASSARLDSCVSSHCSPAWTLRTHSTRRPGADSFSTIPRTPRRSASSTWSSSSAPASRTTFVRGLSFCSSRRISNPSLRGMWTSRIRTSGRWQRTAARVSSPFTQRATTWKSGSSWKRLVSPSSTIGWSSARTRRMGTLPSRPRAGEADVEAGATRARVDRQRPAQGVDPFLQHDRTELPGVQSLVVEVSLEREAAAVVSDDDVHPAVARGQRHAHRGGTRVPCRVRQRLLHEVANVIREVVRRAVQLLELDSDPEAPHVFQPLCHQAQPRLQSHVAGRGAQGIECPVPDEEAQVPLLVGDQVLDLSQSRSEEHTSELQSLAYLVCRLLLEKKKTKKSQC